MEHLATNKVVLSEKAEMHHKSLLYYITKLQKESFLKSQLSNIAHSQFPSIRLVLNLFAQTFDKVQQASNCN